MSDTRLGEFEELVLLAILSLTDNAYAVSIQQCLARKGKRPTSMGAIYTGLDRLEQKGLVRSALGDVTHARGGRRKRFYHVTGAGRAALLAMRDVRERMWQGVTIVPEGGA